MCTGRKRRMSDNRLGIGVRVMCVAVNHTIFPQVAKITFARSIVVTAWQIAAKLIDRDLKDQPGPLLRIRDRYN